jgi:hypothetical protein
VNAIAIRLQPVLIIVGVVWAVEIVNLFTGHSLVALGIHPRSVSGLIGIPLAPLIHGGLWHAISNTLPLVLLGGLTLVGGRERFWEVTLGIVAISGVLVWLLARDAQHVGASGVVFYRNCIHNRLYLRQPNLGRVTATAAQLHFVREPSFRTLRWRVYRVAR